jgi:hypothetical protein
MFMTSTNADINGINYMMVHYSVFYTLAHKSNKSKYRHQLQTNNLKIS